ncbi:MAG: hypothetical protein WBQ24_01770 [Xanthobacteraceae bacterium]
MSDIIASQPATGTLLQLDLGERLFIWGFRSMAEHRRRGWPTMREMRDVYAHFQVASALSFFDELIEAFASTAHTPIEIHSPGCPCVSESETCLLRAAAAAQSGDLDTASHGFSRWIPISATGWLMTPTCAIGRMFQAAGMILPVRHADRANMAGSTAALSWQPAGSRSLH